MKYQDWPNSIPFVIDWNTESAKEWLENMTGCKCIGINIKGENGQ